MKKALVLLVMLAGVATAGDPAPPVRCDPFSDMHACVPMSAERAAEIDKAVARENDRVTKERRVKDGRCDPFSAMHSCNPDKIIAQADAKRPPDPEPERRPAPPPASNAHQACVDAMNADPAFATSILAIADKQIDQKTVAAHQDADYHIQKNEKHVFLAYSAMWVIAALFVLFLWMRQQKLLREIAGLKRDLEVAAAGDAKK